MTSTVSPATLEPVSSRSLSANTAKPTGYTLLLWNNVLNWPKEEYEVFLMRMRKALRNRKVHGYMTVRYVWARKPEATSTKP